VCGNLNANELLLPVQRAELVCVSSSDYANKH